MSYGSNTLLTIRKANIFQDINTVLNDVNFEMEKGEFVYLIGRTGSGKSSLLKTLYADLPLLMGDIQIVGYDLSKIKRKDIPFLRRKLGIIFQDFQLFPDRSVAENLYFVMRATGWRDKGKMKNRMIEVLMLGILVALAMIAHMATVQPGWSLWLFGAFIFVMAATAGGW